MLPCDWTPLVMEFEILFGKHFPGDIRTVARSPVRQPPRCKTRNVNQAPVWSRLKRRLYGRSIPSRHIFGSSKSPASLDARPTKDLGRLTLIVVLKPYMMRKSSPSTKMSLEIFFWCLGRLHVRRVRATQRSSTTLCGEDGCGTRAASWTALNDKEHSMQHSSCFHRKFRTVVTET